MYTIISLTHIIEGDKLQALISFEHNNRTELTTAIIPKGNIPVSDLDGIYANINFIAVCTAAVTDKINLIDNPPTLI